MTARPGRQRKSSAATIASAPRASPGTWSRASRCATRSRSPTASARPRSAAGRTRSKAVAATGVKTVCYNFMPVVDWTRTDLRYLLPTSGLALRFDIGRFRRLRHLRAGAPGRRGDYSDAARVDAARERLSMHEPRAHRAARDQHHRRPAGRASASTTAPRFRAALAEYATMTDDELRGNLADFLREVVPVAEEIGVRLGIHPDDPPFSLFGLPRVVSTRRRRALHPRAVRQPGQRPHLLHRLLRRRGADNDLVGMIARVRPPHPFRASAQRHARGRTAPSTRPSIWTAIDRHGGGDRRAAAPRSSSARTRAGGLA